MGYKKNIIIYGVSSAFDETYYALKTCYRVIAVSDTDSNKRSKVEGLGESFITPDEITLYDFDFIIVASMRFIEIFASLVYTFNIERSKILKASDFLYSELELSLGELNPEKTFYIIRAVGKPENGLLAYITTFIRTLDVIEGRNYEIFIDFQNYPNTYLEDSKLGKENSWEYFFKQPCSEKISNIYNSKNVILGLFHLEYEAFHDVFTDLYRRAKSEKTPIMELIIRDYSLKKELYQKYIITNYEMHKFLNEEFNQLFLPLRKHNKKICGVLYRGTDYTKLKPYLHPIQPTIEQVIEKTKELMREWGFEYIYFDSEDANAFNSFCQAFPNHVIYSERPRIDNYPDTLENVKFNRENDSFLKGKEYLRSFYLMTKCNFFISGVFNASITAHIFSDDFESSFTFNYGLYGIDDDSHCLTPDGRSIYVNKDENKSNTPL